MKNCLLILLAFSLSGTALCYDLSISNANKGLGQKWGESLDLKVWGEIDPETGKLKKGKMSPEWFSAADATVTFFAPRGHREEIESLATYVAEAGYNYGWKMRILIITNIKPPVFASIVNKLPGSYPREFENNIFLINDLWVKERPEVTHRSWKHFGFLEETDTEEAKEIIVSIFDDKAIMQRIVKATEKEELSGQMIFEALNSL